MTRSFLCSFFGFFLSALYCQQGLSQLSGTSPSMPVKSSFYHQYTIEDGLPSNEVYQVIQDKNNMLWFATDRGIAQYNGRNFRIYNLNDGLRSLSFFGFALDRSGGLWCYNYQNEIYRYDGKSFKLHPVSTELQKLSNDKIQQIVWEDHVLWVITTSAIIKYDNQRASVVEVISGNRENDKLSLLTSPGGNRFLTNDSEERGKQVKILESGKRPINPFPYQHHGDTYMAFRNQRLLVHVSSDTIIHHKFNHMVNHSVYVDRSGQLWVGTSNGVYTFDNGDLNKPIDVFLPVESITSVLQDNEGGYWFTTEKNGVYYSRDPGITVISSPEKSKETRIIEMCVRNDSLFYLNQRNDVIACKLDRDRGSLSLVANHRSDLLLPMESKDAKSAIISSDSNYMWIKNMDSSTFLIVRDGLKADDSDTIGPFNTGSSVYRYAHVNKSHIFFGNRFGIQIYNRKTGKKEPISNPLMNVRVNDIKGFEKLTIVATGGAGVYICAENAVIKHFNEQTGLADNFCNTIYIDSKKRICIGTDNGISIISGALENKSVDIISFSSVDGLPAKQIDKCLVEKNWIVAASFNQVYFFRESQKTTHQPDFKVFVTDIRINGKQTDDLTNLSHDENDMRVTTESATFRYNDDWHIRYKLSGLDNRWRYSSNPIIEYTNLAPGDYELIIEGGSRSSGWTGNETSLTFSISKPYWSEIWFIVLVICLISGSVFLFFRWRINTIKRRDWLNNELYFYRQQALGLQMNPHFLFNSINSIQASVLKSNTSDLLNHLSSFANLIRLVFRISNKNLVELDKEIEVLSNYLRFEKIRFKDQMDFEIIADDEIPMSDLLLPPLLLQPIVENCIKHGRPPNGEPVKILIRIINSSDKVVTFSIEDNGIGFNSLSNKHEDERHLSSGLRLVRKRLELLQKWLGKETLFSIQKNDQSIIGAQITLVMPKIYKTNLS